jgi:hypothetical protein
MIDKVIMSLQKPDDMETINLITNLDFDSTDNWADLQTFEENPELKKFITDEEFNALKNKDADYIAFRIDY